MTGPPHSEPDFMCSTGSDPSGRLRDSAPAGEPSPPFSLLSISPSPFPSFWIKTCHQHVTDQNTAQHQPASHPRGTTNHTCQAPVARWGHPGQWKCSGRGLAHTSHHPLAFPLFRDLQGPVAKPVASHLEEPESLNGCMEESTCCPCKPPGQQQEE